MTKVLKPKQKLFIEAYLTPQSHTFNNALQSGLKAGFTQEYSENITHLKPKWLDTTLSETLGDQYLTNQALSNLNQFLTSERDDERGIKWQATQMVLKGLQSSRWSEKKDIKVTLNTEVTLSVEKQDKLLRLLGVN